ncbi:hypothetical protein MTO96_051244 [Rhipicephalus appendiculatus]
MKAKRDCTATSSRSLPIRLQAIKGEGIANDPHSGSLYISGKFPLTSLLVVMKHIFAAMCVLGLVAFTAKDEDLKAQSDEYFLLDLWQKTTEAIKNATKEVTVSVTGALEVTKDQLTKAAKDAQDKLKVKAAEIMAKILAKITSQYALEDSSTHTEVMKTIRDLIQAAVNGLLKAGKGFRQLEN